MGDERNYKVGYGRPPLHTRFKKGKSGNPTGRRRTAPSLAELMEKELRKKVTITENGEIIRVTKEQALVKRLVNGALKGDMRAVKHVFDARPKPEVLVPGEQQYEVTIVFDGEDGRAALDE